MSNTQIYLRCVKGIVVESLGVEGYGGDARRGGDREGREEEVKMRMKSTGVKRKSEEKWEDKREGKKRK